MTESVQTRWGRLRAAVAPPSASSVARKRGTVLVNGDCRDVLRHVPDGSIDCVVTSPPYGELKDYGADGQIGFGQVQDTYLKDIGSVLHELHRACRDGAALWMVLDTVKTSGKTVLLPWEVIKRAQDEGWSLEDQVIWDKGRSLPWSHPGRFRGVFEYVLLFAKARLRRFDLDRIRETDHLSPYWVKYPERYSPEGKAPSDLWHFPIPVQGSWSRNGISHSCPFPLPMVARMIGLTTDPGDVVLDPFAGTGTVMAVASFMGRRSLGIEINPRFVAQFREKGYESLAAVAKAELKQPHHGRRRNVMRGLIVRLRTLKYAKTLFNELSRPDRLGAAARTSLAAFIVTKRTHRKSTPRARRVILAHVRVAALARSEPAATNLRRVANDLMLIPPLSKFGLDVELLVLSPHQWHSSQFFRQTKSRRWYLYKKGSFNCYERSVASVDFPAVLDPVNEGKEPRIPPILSPIRVKVLVGLNT